MSKRKVVIVSAALISVVLISLVFYFTLRTPIIGIIKGAENEIIEIDGITYIVDDLAENGANSYSSADRGNFIGVVSNGDITMRVYTVKVVSRVMRKFDLALAEIYFRGRVHAPWLPSSGQGAKGQGRRYAARLALDAL